MAALIIGLLLLPLLPFCSSMVFELHGDVYPTGHIYVTMSIGEPEKPYFLDLDTGSTLTWLECNAPCKSCHKVPHELYRPRNNLVPCEDERCVAVHRDVRFKHDCKENPNRCDYDVRYAGGDSSLGMLIADKFSLPGSDARPTLTFGCGYDQKVKPDQEGGKAEMPVDGVLGIGRGTGDLASQLKQQGMITENVIGHCLGIQGGGYLFFGGEEVPSSVVTWVPMVSNAQSYYSPGLATLHFNGNLGNPISVAPMEVVIDSGSTYTYMPTETYRRLVTVVIASLRKSSLTLVRDPALLVCWAGKEPFKSIGDVKGEFKPLQLAFIQGTSQAIMEIPPENYLIITGRGNVCMGILDGTQIGLRELNVIGDVTMQNQLVIYDNERGQIGWARAPCVPSV